jgi:ubiquitin thioesterase OTU1
MRARYKSPSGTGTIDAPDSLTVGQLLDELRTRTGIKDFTVKFGPPMAMKTLDTSLATEPARSLGIHGETLTIVPEEPRSVSTVHQGTEKQHRTPGKQMRHGEEEKPEDIHVPWPERDGILCEKPSDLLHR